MNAHSHPHDPDHDHPHDHSHSHEHAESAGFEASAREEGPARRRVEVTVAQSAVDRAYERVYRDLSRTARVKGFRPGKVPRRVLQRLYGPAVGEDIERMLVRDTLAPALARAGVEAISTPSIEAEAPSPGAPFQYAAVVEVRPEIALPPLEGLPARKPLVLVGEDEIDRELEGLRQRNAVIVEEDEDVPAREGHILTLDYVGRIGGEAFEGGTGRDVDLEIGTGRFVPGFEEQLTGVRSGEDREVTVSFPEDYDPSVAGKQAVFQVHVAAVKRRDVPALDDDFARDLGEFDTLDALRQKVGDDLREGQQRRAEAELRRSLTDALLERCDFEVPPGAVDQELERRLRMAAQELLRGGVPEEALAQQIERWRFEWRPEAERELREHWVLEAVATDQAVEIEDAAVAERIEQWAAGQGVSVEVVRQQVDMEALEASVRVDLRRERALDFIASTAKVEETANT